MASSEAEAAGAAKKVTWSTDTEMVNSEEDSSEVDSLIDYNEEDELKAAKKATAKVALREMLINNGNALKGILRTEKMKTHYVSPFSEEDAMSIEDILGEIPKEDLHEVGMIQGRIFMPASFVQKWVIPTIRVRKALNDHEPKLPGGIETAMLFAIFDQSILDLTKNRHSTDEKIHSIRALATCAQDANHKLIERMRKGGDGIKDMPKPLSTNLNEVFKCHHWMTCSTCHKAIIIIIKTGLLKQSNSIASILKEI